MTEDTTQGDSLPHAVSLPEEAEPREETEGRIYEVGYLIMPAVPEADLSREVTGLKDVLDREKAAIISEEFPRLRQLAYPMYKRTSEGYQKHVNAYFGWLKFEASPESTLQIERGLKGFPNLLRYLLIKTVREHTLTLGRPRAGRRERKEVPRGVPASAPVSEVELDKSLEKLIAE